MKLTCFSTKVIWGKVIDHRSVTIQKMYKSFYISFGVKEIRF